MSTFTQIYLHVVFAVQGRYNLIEPAWEERLHKYLTGAFKENGQRLLAIGGTTNHIHFAVGYKPTIGLPELVREIKKSSNVFIKENKLCKMNFAWQEGYGAFSFSPSHLDAVVKYILTQKEHHQKRSFRDEYMDLLRKYSVEHNDKYINEWLQKVELDSD